MAKAHLPGTHLLRVRIAKRVFLQLQEVAEEESERTGEHVTVSDLARRALYNELLVKDSMRQLENLPPELMGEDDDIVSIFQNPMLSAGG